MSGYNDYRKRVRVREGVTVEVDTRVYPGPGSAVHPLTMDRAIYFNVAARTVGSEHRVHIAEVRTQLSEHQHELARKLVDHICQRLKAGTLDLEAEALLAFEDLTPDKIEEWVTA